MSDLQKKAMDYARLGRPGAELVSEDLSQATSLEAIKQATADHGVYPDADPFGELLRAKQCLDKMADDAVAASIRNQRLVKEAAEGLEHNLGQFLLGGGNIGEAAQAMGSAVANTEWVKVALAEVVPGLIERGVIDPTQHRAQSISYEMEKGASVRAVNPDNPIVQTFSAFVKAASNQVGLDNAAEKLATTLDDVNETLGRAALKKEAVVGSVVGKAIGALSAVDMANQAKQGIRKGLAAGKPQKVL